jgi:hypothetical protein
MPRPRKADVDKRDNRVTLYLSDDEQNALREVSELQARSMDPDKSRKPSETGYCGL